MRRDKESERLYQIKTESATGGLLVDKDGFVVETAPYFHRFLGKKIEELIKVLPRRFKIDRIK